MFIGGTGIQVLKKSWAHCTTSFSKAKCYIWYVLLHLSVGFSAVTGDVSTLQGASDMPAWVVAKANQYARDRALTPFVIYQGSWNVMDRSLEREILPMARSEGDFHPLSLFLFISEEFFFWCLGMAIAPWNVLAGGKFRTDAEEEKRAASGENGRVMLSTEWRRTEGERKISQALEKVAGEVGAKHITSGSLEHLVYWRQFLLC